MAVFSTTSQSAFNLGAEGNIREDLGNVIFNVTPYQTPFTSGIAKPRTPHGVVGCILVAGTLNVHKTHQLLRVPVLLVHASSFG